MHQIEHFELATPQPVSLKLGVGCVVRVTHGRLWLTRPGQLDDVWLQAGESWTLPASGQVWIGAEPAAQFQLALAVRPWRFSWIARLGQRLPVPSAPAGLPLRVAHAR